MLSRTRTILACAAAAAAAGLAVSLAAPAMATTAVAAGAVAGPHGQLEFTSNGHAAGPATAATTSNRTFAGYQTGVPAGSATVLTASFTVPALSCTTTDRGIAADAGVLVSKTASVSGVFIGCVSGAAVYYPWVFVNGTETDYASSPVAVGDVIDLTTKVSTNRTRVQVTDVTTGVTQKIIGAGASAGAAFIGDDGWGDSSGNLEHVPAFGKLTFKTCVLDAMALASWRPQAYQRVNSIGTLQISNGNLWPGGTAFTTHFVHS